MRTITFPILIKVELQPIAIVAYRIATLLLAFVAIQCLLAAYGIGGIIRNAVLDPNVLVSLAVEMTGILFAWLDRIVQPRLDP